MNSYQIDCDRAARSILIHAAHYRNNRILDGWQVHSLLDRVVIRFNRRMLFHCSTIRGKGITRVPARVYETTSTYRRDRVCNAVMRVMDWTKEQEIWLNKVKTLEDICNTLPGEACEVLSDQVQELGLPIEYDLMTESQIDQIIGISRLYLEHAK